MYLISSRLVHLYREDFLFIKTNSFENQIVARKEQMNMTKRKVDRIIESIMEEFQYIFPSYVDAQIISTVKHNADIINETPAEKLEEFRKSVSVAKERAIKRVTDELSESQDWFSCEKRGIDVGGGLWHIIKSIEKEFRPVFNDLKFRSSGSSVMGATDLMPLNLDAFQSEGLRQLNGELIKILEDYCSKEEGLEQLQNSFSEKKAVERWQNPT